MPVIYLMFKTSTQTLQKEHKIGNDITMVETLFLLSLLETL